MFFYDFPELIAYRTEIRNKLPFIPLNFFKKYIPIGDEDVEGEVNYILKYR